MSEEKPETGATAGEPREQSMLYEVCPHCGGTGGNMFMSGSGRPIPCCKMLGVVETGATARQLNYLVGLDKLRQEAGISAAMLRDGRAKKIVEERHRFTVQQRAATIPNAEHKEAACEEINPGDIVLLRSGGPHMVVEKLVDDDGTPSAECTWFQVSIAHTGGVWTQSVCTIYVLAALKRRRE